MNGVFWIVNKELFMYIKIEWGSRVLLIGQAAKWFSTFIVVHFKKWYFFIITSNLFLIAAILTASLPHKYMFAEWKEQITV